MSHNEFNQQYAPSHDVENNILNYFVSQGMQAQIVNHTLRIQQLQQQIEKTLKVKMNHYHYKNKTVYSNTTKPKLRSDIAQYVSEISGLNNIPRFQPMLRERPPSI